MSCGRSEGECVCVFKGVLTPCGCMDAMNH